MLLVLAGMPDLKVTAPDLISLILIRPQSKM